MSAMRGRLGVFREAMSAIHKGLDVGLLVNMYVVLSPRNICELDDFYSLAREAGVHACFCRTVMCMRNLSGQSGRSCTKTLFSQQVHA
ncbi:MAG: hypothetical protein Q8J68_07085 [Methanolobus sp.]|uniref:hypothetical protein n=1 Tax=Methanolobus sp. TaxID=1874737 RepID=UPI0027320B43|nr:hypothetical protein [Methanolobus sp.]MDP2217028.1 hypothetical protein [Methanolobus sp.]